MNWEVRTMRSKTSFFNATLFRKDLSRFWPLWGMASFGGALFPLAMLTEWLRHRVTMAPLEFTSHYYEVVSYAVPIVMLCYSVLCAMAVWGYLYNGRSVGLMHTLPIRREGLFVTHTLAGLVMICIPCAVTGLLAVLLSLLCGGFDPVGLGVTVLAVAGEGIFYFASATLVAFIVGNVFALPVLYFIFHFLAVGLDYLVSAFASNLIFGLPARSYSGLVNFLSPTVFLLQNVSAEAEYAPPVPDLRTYTNTITSVHLYGGWIIGAYTLVGVVLLAAAYLLYRRRRSESAGDVISVGWMKPVFSVGVTACSALAGGQMLYYIFWNAFGGGERYSLIPLILCMFVAGAIGFYAASMLLKKSLRVFQGSGKAMAAVAVGCVLVCCAVAFDVFGVESRIPETGEIETAYLSVAGNRYTLYAGEDDTLIDQVRDLHRSITADAAYARDFSYLGQWDDGVDYEYVTLVYQLKNGRRLERDYPLYLTRARMGQSGTFDFKLDQLVNGTAMRIKRLHAEDRRYLPESGSLYLDRRDRNYDLSSREVEQLLAALRADALTGAWGTYDWFDQSEEDEYAMECHLSFRSVVDERRDYIFIRFRSGMTNTIACLESMGYVAPEDLVTWAELDALRSGLVDEDLAEGPWTVDGPYLHEEATAQA